jgi:hypothetical protein
MTQPEDQFQQPDQQTQSESGDSFEQAPGSLDDAPDSSKPAADPPARMPGALTPPPAPPTPAVAPMPVSTSADHDDTQAWEVPPPSATAGAAAASQWAQPPSPPLAPPPPPPAAFAAAPVTSPPPAQTWQPAQPGPPPSPAQQWQPQQPPAPHWQGQQPPAQQNWQQPAQQWPQPQQAQYQQPYPQQPYGQPNPYGQPYAQQQWAPQPLGYGTSPLAAFAGLLLLVFGIGVAALGVFALNLGGDIGRFIRDNDIAIFGSQISRDTLRSVLSPSPGVLIALGVVQLLCGAGVLAHKSWGRWLGFVVALLGLLVSLVAVSVGLALAGGLTPAVIVAVVLLVGYALIVLALLAGGRHFRRKTA